MDTQLGQEELGMALSTLPAFFLMVQFVAFFGSLIFGYLARRVGTRLAIIISLLVWSSAMVYAAALLRSTTQFFVLGLILLTRVNIRQAAIEAGNEAPART